MIISIPPQGGINTICEEDIIDMKISINGYKNLENVCFDIVEEKINIIFGMSGSGKSSIPNALLKEDLEENSTIGKNIEQIIEINGSEELPEIISFDSQYVNRFIVEKSVDNVFNVFIDSTDEIVNAEKSLNGLLMKLSNAMDASMPIYNEYLNFKNTLGSTLSTSGKLKATSKLVKLKNSLSKVSGRLVIKQIQEIQPEHLKWIKEGMRYKKDDICPFCEKKISQKKIKSLNDLNNFEEKTIDSVIKVQNNGIIGSIKFTQAGINKLETDLISIIHALDEYDQLRNAIKNVKNYESYDSKEWSGNYTYLKQYFPDVYNAFIQLKTNSGKIKRLMEKAHEKTKSILSRRTNKINGYLLRMSIPYKIEAEYANSRIRNYKIIHTDDKENADRPKAPSAGEKNIIALLMYIFQCKSENPDIVIIDDPASNYDDFRKSQILKIIKDELKNMTVLLLSHDDKFAKYAVVDKYFPKGKLMYFENFGEKAIFTEISKDDFGDFYEYVIERIKSTTDYYQKIINLRFLYEGKRKNDIYGYLSAIIHNTRADDIQCFLKANNTNEEKIIKTIKKDYPKLSRVEIPFYKDDIKINLENYSILEKAILAREKVKPTPNKDELLDELNEFAHINGKLKVCLNPYKYNFCTKRLYNYLKKYNNEIS